MADQTQKWASGPKGWYQYYQTAFDPKALPEPATVPYSDELMEQLRAVQKKMREKPYVQGMGNEWRSTAVPMSWSSPARLACFTLSPSSAAMMPQR